MSCDVQHEADNYYRFSIEVPNTKLNSMDIRLLVVDWNRFIERIASD